MDWNPIDVLVPQRKHSKDLTAKAGPIVGTVRAALTRYPDTIRLGYKRAAQWIWMSEEQVNQVSGYRQWSKDFVEHLRTVHFSLAVLSLGLAIVAFTQRATTTGRALMELETIISLSQQLNAGWIESRCKISHDLWRAQIIDTDTGEDASGALHDHVIAVGGASYFYAPRKECTFVTSLPSSSERRDVSGVGVEGRTFRGVIPTHSFVDRPTNLAQFVALWDLLKDNPQIIVPTELDRRWISAEPSVSPQPYEIKSLDRDTLASEPLVLDMAVVAGIPSFVYRSRLNGGYVAVEAFKHKDFIGMDQVWALLSQLDKVSLWHGSFAESFPELLDAAQGRETSDFEFLRRSLKVEAERTEESFEAFGLKMPTPTTAAWGVLVLIGVQLYFLAHFKELSRRLHPEDEGWQVAWIGIYSGVFSRSLFVISALVLPSASAIVIVSISFARFAESSMRFLLVIFAIVSSVLAVVTGRAWSRLLIGSHPHSI
jgi:hypothetical protein